MELIGNVRSEIPVRHSDTVLQVVLADSPLSSSMDMLDSWIWNIGCMAASSAAGPSRELGSST